MGLLDNSFFRFIGIKSKPKAPWKKYYKKNDMNINPPDVSIFRFARDRMKDLEFKNRPAITYFGTTRTYTEFYNQIHIAAKAFKSTVESSGLSLK